MLDQVRPEAFYRYLQDLLLLLDDPTKEAMRELHDRLLTNSSEIDGVVEMTKLLGRACFNPALPLQIVGAANTASPDDALELGAFSTATDARHCAESFCLTGGLPQSFLLYLDIRLPARFIAELLGEPENDPEVPRSHLVTDFTPGSAPLP